MRSALGGCRQWRYSWWGWPRSTPFRYAFPGEHGPSGATAGGRTITVGASRSGSGGGGPGGATGGGGAGQVQNPWLCVDTKLVLNDEGGFAAGGPTPGSWYSVTCINQVTGASTTATEWIPDQAAATTPAANPYVLALQAENSLRLPSPTVHFNPADFSVVNLATWLWIGSGHLASLRGNGDGRHGERYGSGHSRSRSRG